MTLFEINEQFDQLCEKAFEADAADDYPLYEKTFLHILQLVKNNISYRDFFITKFITVLETNNSPYEVVAFCMHELKWPEIYEYAENEIINSQDPRVETAFRSLMNAYEEIWDYANLYSYYSNEANN